MIASTKIIWFPYFSGSFRYDSVPHKMTIEINIIIIDLKLTNEIVRSMLYAIINMPNSTNKKLSRVAIPAPKRPKLGIRK